MSRGPSLAPAILDAFSNLNVAPARLRQICDHVLSQLGSYSPECLQSSSSFSCSKVALLLRGVADVAATTMAQPITALDLLVLVLLLHHQNAHRRGAETTVIKLASTGRLTAAMAAAMFARHTRAFLMCFKSIAQEVDAATPVLLLSLATDHPKLLHSFALMLNGILDCLSNLHFIHIWQLFRVLTTLTFDRQRIPAAGLIDDENEDELKRIDTIAAATVTHTWLALANDAGISIDGDHLSSLLQVLQLIYVDKSTNGCAPHAGEMYSNFSPEYTRAREVGKDTHVVVSEKTLEAPFETKLTLLSGIAAVFAGMMRSKTVVELLARGRVLATSPARQEVVGALVAHIGTGQAQEVDAAMPVLLLSLATDHPKLLHPFALMLNGILDCLSNLHFIHIWQLFRVLTTLTFDRQRIPAAGLIDHEKEDELKRTGTIAAATVTRTLFALANDADISIDDNHLSSLLQALHFIYVDNTNSHQEQAHLSGCVNGDGGLTIDPPPPQPFGFRSLADPGRHVWRPPGSPSARSSTTTPSTRLWFEQTDGTRAREVGKHTLVVVNEKTLQASCETKLKLLSGIAAVFAGTVRCKTDVAFLRTCRVAEARCRDADVFLFLMSLQPFVWWNLSLGTDNLNPEDGDGGRAWACSDNVLFRTVADNEDRLATQPSRQAAVRRARWATEPAVDTAARSRADGTTFPPAAPWS
ncbi:hypothetical protein PTSG_13134 [Salpingoeca rosetta]|uniref:Uncharacterized protein n=1 Tax=Salpingoeca rosetta (strain ATCC 50818 / BSB-021) TaxID=946362 RepID=F2USI2_SALR5|nr:uncharacterized protein PTSG_13134 [Salpingoeca rosetta]EGD81091.1 hypothetical protein PTSG_13134 [Salpingoeca rosetta]|eukprot:XP_004987960.1 hypothetical protein PTSG_13134 [Salpingoeca rosetta]